MSKTTSPDQSRMTAPIPDPTLDDAKTAKGNIKVKPKKKRKNRPNQFKLRR